MTNSLRIAIAQINVSLGDLTGNIEKHVHAAEKARAEGADIVVFPELSLTGYPPEDLLLRHDFLNASQHATDKLIQKIKGIYCLIGYPAHKKNRCYNTSILFYDGNILAEYQKQYLPNYGVFDEQRYFTPGEQSVIVNIKNVPVGILICEDIWHKNAICDIAEKGAKVLLVPNASPFEINKHEARVTLLTAAAKKYSIDIIYANLIGGQDELIFDGGGMAIKNDGSLHCLMPFFKEAVQLIDYNDKPNAIAVPAPIKRVYDALCLGMSDYVNKNKISGALVGLSGGIDSALTLAIAVDSLGSDRVHAIMMPSEYTADISKEDAAALAKNLGVRYDIIPINQVYQTFLSTLTPMLTATTPSITYENLQARARGIILMALSNASGKIVLNTGNRSELATGYCTLYGDMIGGFAVLKDVLKTMVYDLARYRNTINAIIPERIISRAPTAELAPHQKDEDSLPPYAILDQILELYLTQLKSKKEILTCGFDEAIVEKVIQLVHRNEYKRKQAPIGTHINHKSFGKDWRFPLTNKWT